MNITLLLAALLVVCIPAAGSPLRLPNTRIFSFTPEAIDSGSFEFNSQRPMPEAWIPPESGYAIEPESPPIEFSVVTDLITGTAFGPLPAIAVPDKTEILDPAPFPTSGHPDFLFYLFTGIAGCSVRFVFGGSRSFSSQLPQIIHLTRFGRLP